VVVVVVGELICSRGNFHSSPPNFATLSVYPYFVPQKLDVAHELLLLVVAVLVQSSISLALLLTTSTTSPAVVLLVLGKALVPRPQ